MKRPRSPRTKSSDALESFRKLARADALLFHVAEILKEMKFRDVALSLEPVRAEVAKRLEAHQDGAYKPMGSKRRALRLRQRLI